MKNRVLAVHDISCVGRCSLTVALPIISACGVECSVLPTVVLSTHTGGFSGFTFRDLTCDIQPIVNHWDSLGLRFNAVYTGFLGTLEQIALVEQSIHILKADNSVVLVDPVMADNGVLYSIFDANYVEHMKRLVQSADIVAPNITEACLLTGETYAEAPHDKDYIIRLVKKLKSMFKGEVVLKGVMLDDTTIGAAVTTGESIEFVLGERQSGFFHGTGDVFGSMLIAAHMRGKSLVDSVRHAVDYVIDCIKFNQTQDKKYGVDFEIPLAEHASRLNK